MRLLKANSILRKSFLWSQFQNSYLFEVSPSMWNCNKNYVQATLKQLLKLLRDFDKHSRLRNIEIPFDPLKTNSDRKINSIKWFYSVQWVNLGVYFQLVFTFICHWICSFARFVIDCCSMPKKLLLLVKRKFTEEEKAERYKCCNPISLSALYHTEITFAIFFLGLLLRNVLFYSLTGRKSRLFGFFPHKRANK